ncbi:MAG TPA: DUF2905 domain-containing protein [Micromonosporaceae bacterium]|nr:DUF2905 domain-containing protein [Micromonosporaceae bacterium]HCU48671.1 DUF2905 domain-containing protein [Micromonosporaceae bacterium]
MSKDLGPWLVGAGIFVVILGILAWTGGLSWFGRLPGDIRIETETTRVYIPITSMILVSVALSILLGIFNRR